MEMLKDEKILEKEGDDVKRRQGNTKKTQKIKKNIANNAEDTKERKHGEGGDVGGREHFKVVKNVVLEKIHKKKKNGAEDVSQATSDKTQNVDIVDREQELDRGFVDKVEKKKKKKDKDNRKKSDFDYQFQKLQNEKIAETGVLDGCIVEKIGKKKRKRENREANNATQQSEDTSTKAVETDVACDINVKKKRKQPNSIENGSHDAKPGKQKKNVRFSDHVEIFPLSDHKATLVQGKDHEEKLVQGKRFTPEENEILRKAVQDYIDAHNLGDEGLNMVLNCRSHPEVRNCWKEIAMAIPYRPKWAIYHRAHNLLNRSDNKEWTDDALEMIKESQEKNGNKWKALAVELGKNRVHVKDVWRRIKSSNRKKGHWSQDEYQGLYDLINLDMKLRLKEEKKSKHGMLRSNISFEAISDKLSTRSCANCCLKWYRQLTSSMVAEGLWLDTDDYRLINALYEMDASCIEDVDWDSLLEHRSGDLCRKRWNQMALHIGYHGTRSFAEQVDVLSKRYCPDLMEVQEAWESKPVIDV